MLRVILINPHPGSSSYCRMLGLSRLLVEMLTLLRLPLRVVFSLGAEVAADSLAILIPNACQKMRMVAHINQNQK